MTVLEQAAWLTALMLLLALPLSGARAHEAPTRGEAYERCMTSHFSVPGVTTNEQRRFASMMTVRALQGHCSREVQATLAKPFEASGDISVTVIKSRNDNSLLEQLEKLETRYPDRSYDELCREIEVEREAHRVGADHPLADRFREIERLSISPMPPRDVVLDGNRYSGKLPSRSTAQVAQRTRPSLPSRNGFCRSSVIWNLPANFLVPPYPPAHPMVAPTAATAAAPANVDDPSTARRTERRTARRPERMTCQILCAQYRPRRLPRQY
jgi:hypothetical protein